MEVADILESSYRRKKAEYEEKIKINVMLLDIFGKNLIDKMVASLGQENIKYSLTEYFPEFFDFIQNSSDKDTKEKMSTENTSKKLSSEMEIYKAKRIHDAYLRNQKRKEKE